MEARATLLAFMKGEPLTSQVTAAEVTQGTRALQIPDLN
jgi:hypothetical protein